MFTYDNIFKGIEKGITLPKTIHNPFKKAKRRFLYPLNNYIASLIPLTIFPVLSLNNPIFSILALFFLMLVSQKKENFATSIELAFFLSLGFFNSELIPFCFVWILSSYLLSQHNKELSDPLHRFMHMSLIVLHPPLVMLFAPLFFIGMGLLTYQKIKIEISQ